MDTLKFLTGEITELSFADKLRLFAILNAAIFAEIAGSDENKRKWMQELTDKFIDLLEDTIQKATQKN